MATNEPNPYEPPKEAPQPFGLDSPRAQLTPQEVTAFVGRKAGYYLRKWSGALDGTGDSTGFNWAALLLSGLWLPYRKMYLTTTIFMALILLESIVEEVVYVGVLGRPKRHPGRGGSWGLSLRSSAVRGETAGIYRTRDGRLPNYEVKDCPRMNTWPRWPSEANQHRGFVRVHRIVLRRDRRRVFALEILFGGGEAPLPG